MEKKSNVKGTLILALAAFLWGASFVSQNEGVKILDPYAFNGIRSVLGAIALLPVIYILTAIGKKNGTYKKPIKEDKKLLCFAGLCCGLVLCAASTTQTLGVIQGAGEAGFVTALYIVFVPIFSVFLRRRIPRRAWLAVMIGLIGMYLLCGSFAFNINQIFLVIGSIFFACHILVIDYFSPKVDGVKLSCVQFLVCGIIDCIIMLFNDVPTMNEIIACAVPIAYAGLVSCSVAYTLQIVGQKYTSVTAGSLAMSLESVFSVICGWLIQGDSLNEREIFGCVLIFSAIVIVQIPIKKLIRS